MNFIAPKNFKRGRLIGNKYRPIDLVIAIGLITFSVVFVLTYALGGGTNLIVIMILLMPCLFSALILVPLDFYHNVIQRLFLWISFITGRKEWKWQGIYHYMDVKQDEKRG